MTISGSDDDLPVCNEKAAILVNGLWDTSLRPKATGIMTKAVLNKKVIVTID